MTRRRWLWLRVVAIISATVVLAGCHFSIETGGSSPADERVSVAVARYLESIEGFAWPDRVFVADREVTVWYPRWEGEDTWDVDVEIESALAQFGDVDGWSIVYRSTSTGREFNSRQLPVTEPDPSPEPD